MIFLATSSISESAKKELSKGVFVGNLAFGVEDEALWRHFKCCGVIKDVRVVRDPNNGMGKGFGYVNFEVTRSLLLNPSHLDASTTQKELNASVYQISNQSGFRASVNQNRKLIIESTETQWNIVERPFQTINGRNT